MCLQRKSLENIVGNGDIPHNELFLLFPQFFLPISRIFFHFHQIWNCYLQTLLVWKSLKFVIWQRVDSGRKLRHIHSKVFGDDRLHVAQMLPAFSPFPTMFSKATSFIKYISLTVDLIRCSPLVTKHGSYFCCVQHQFWARISIREWIE